MVPNTVGFPSIDRRWPHSSQDIVNMTFYLQMTRIHTAAMRTSNPTWAIGSVMTSVIQPDIVTYLTDYQFIEHSMGIPTVVT